ncbi:uncharacterized protein LOC132276505 isoform X2 [Cornus florida]|uniref:uncharacterized protein LOC132276505 isoform X2 n=1 Tax=Cornus florida TaxID=4283 RepID=UPI0028A29857|nr:uncharacterized protein LOC132276505 isoform X2 [Cornus florida]
MASLTDLARMLCMLVTEYPETDKVEIIPEYSGVIDKNQAITLNSRKPTGIDVMLFRGKSVGGGEGVVLLIYKNGRDTGATLNPAHLIKYVLIVVKPEHGNVATFGKLAKGDFFRRISGLGFLLPKVYSSRPLVRIPQYYQVSRFPFCAVVMAATNQRIALLQQRVLEENAPALVAEEGRNNTCSREEQYAASRTAIDADLRMLEENAPALVVAGLDAGGRNNMCLREEQAATYRAALEVDLVADRVIPRYYRYFLSPKFFLFRGLAGFYTDSLHSHQLTTYAIGLKSIPVLFVTIHEDSFLLSPSAYLISSKRRKRKL